MRGSRFLGCRDNCLAATLEVGSLSPFRSKRKAMEHLTKAEAMFQDVGMEYWLGDTRKALAGLRSIS